MQRTIQTNKHEHELAIMIRVFIKNELSFNIVAAQLFNSGNKICIIFLLSKIIILN